VTSDGNPPSPSPRQLLLGSFQAAISAADPLKIVPQHLPKPPKGKTLVVGAGKAAAAMALAVEQNWPANAPLDGLVITRYQHVRRWSRPDHVKFPQLR
jgi:glycerate 2-kinase